MRTKQIKISAQVLTRYTGTFQNLNLTWPLMASIHLTVFLSNTFTLRVKKGDLKLMRFHKF